MKKQAEKLSSEMRELVYRAVESDTLDYKAAFCWTRMSRVQRAKIVRHCLALANTRGGHIVIGVGEDASGHPSVYQGLTREESRSFDPSTVGPFINHYVEPPIDFTIERPLIDGKRYAVFVIRPFRSLPHVCTCAIENELTNVLGHDTSFETENRVQEKIDNDAMLSGYKLVVGALCVLLALIGIANVFSNTLGFVRQRKREFARYMSIGMTPEGMRKMFCVEALVIAGRPVLITLPVTAVFVWLMIRASYLNPMEFWSAAPIVPVALFIAVLFGFVGLAYYLGGRQILKCDLVEVLQSDYM